LSAIAPASRLPAGVWSGTVTHSVLSSSRFLALWLPCLATDRLRREARSGRCDAPADRPLVTVETVRSTSRIAAACPDALRLGLTPGLTLADARARVPALSVMRADPTADRALLDRLADVCDRYTPLVALDPPDGLMLDITGCAHLFGGEAAMLTEVINQFRDLGVRGRAAIASASGTARAVARHGTGGIVAEGEESKAVCRLPVAALEIADETATALARAGLRIIDDLASRPRAPLAARFGGDLLARLDEVLGKTHAPISPRRPSPALLAERRFSDPVATDEDIQACLLSLARQIAITLDGQASGGRCFEAVFFRVDGDVRRITVETAQPLRDPASIQRLFSARLDALVDPLDAGFGFDLIRLGVLAAAPFDSNQYCLDGRAGADHDVAELVNQLSARFGPGALSRLVAVDSHDPDRAAATRPALANLVPAPAWHRPPQDEPPARPLFLFERPQPIETLAEVPDGPPLRFRWRRVLHEVTRAEGPERIDPEWWRVGDDTLTRDYYRVEDSAGRRFWLYREGLHGETTFPPRWFLHGLFA
jgi:protein ImuB